MPPISDFSSSEEDELPQKSFDQHQYHERYQIQSNGYTSRRKSDPRLPAMRPSKVPRQEQQAVSASTVVVSSQQLPISQMTVSGSMPCSDPYSVDAPIAFIATLDYPESADTENAELEPSIKLEVKEEVVEPEDSNQQFVMATKHEQQVGV